MRNQKASRPKTPLNGRILKYEVCDFSSANAKKKTVFFFPIVIIIGVNDTAECHFRFYYASLNSFYLYAINVCSRLVSMVVVLVVSGRAKFRIHYYTITIVDFGSVHLHTILASAQWNRSLDVNIAHTSLSIILDCCCCCCRFDSSFIRSSLSILAINRCAHNLRTLFNGIQVILATRKSILIYYFILLFQLSSVPMALPLIEESIFHTQMNRNGIDFNGKFRRNSSSLQTVDAKAGRPSESIATSNYSIRASALLIRPQAKYAHVRLHRLGAQISI